MKLILILFIVSNCFAYFGQTHRSITGTASTHLEKIGFREDSDTVNKYIEILKEGSVAPDRDKADIEIPEELQYLEIDLGKTWAKWQHGLPNDIPIEVENRIRELSKYLNIKFQYADGAIIEWFNKAVNFYKSGRIDSAMYHLGRTCHLIQDITVPMHTSVKGNVIDVWYKLNKNTTNHDRFEMYCSEIYKPMIKSNEIILDFSIPISIYEIADRSRKQLKYCDGIGYKIFSYFPLNVLVPWLAEDYNKAANYILKEAEINTTKLLIYFFEKVDE